MMIYYFVRKNEHFMLQCVVERFKMNDSKTHEHSNHYFKLIS